MKKFLLLAALLFSISASAFAGSERLIGTWKSNKEATLEYLKTHTKLTPQQLEKVGGTLGKMVILFDAEKVTLKSGNWQFVSKYKIISESKTTLTIESDDPGTRKPTKSEFELDVNGFWTPDDKIAGYKERFDKVKTGVAASVGQSK